VESGSHKHILIDKLPNFHWQFSEKSGFKSRIGSVSLQEANSLVQFEKQAIKSSGSAPLVQMRWRGDV
jgi:hypothetical protein